MSSVCDAWQPFVCRFWFQSSHPCDQYAFALRYRVLGRLGSSFFVAASEALARPCVRPSVGVDGRYESLVKSAAIHDDMTWQDLLDLMSQRRHRRQTSLNC